MLLLFFLPPRTQIPKGVTTHPRAVVAPSDPRTGCASLEPAATIQVPRALPEIPTFMSLMTYR
jgi:hypothetical protein